MRSPELKEIVDDVKNSKAYRIRLAAALKPETKVRIVSRTATIVEANVDGALVVYQDDGNLCRVPLSMITEVLS